MAYSMIRQGFLKQSVNILSVANFCSKPTSSHYDIIIAGGGLVGTTLACSLARNSKLAGRRILLLEGAPKFKRANLDGYSNRVSALSGGTIELMKSLGAWDHIEATRFKAVRQMQVWDACSNAHISFAHETGDPVAYIVENDVVLEAVYKALEHETGVEILNQAKFEGCKLPQSANDRSSIDLKTGEQFTCDLLIGADGHNSVVRKEMGGTNVNISYNQMGVVATVALTDANSNYTAWQRFLPSGPVAILPLTDTLSSLVWSTSPAHAKDLLKMEPQEFIDALNEAYYKEYKQEELVKIAMQGIESLLGTTMGSGAQYPPRISGIIEKSRAAFPLGFNHVSQYVTRGAVIVGDAAHRIHPLAGQGVNLGFGDVKCLTEVLAEAAYRGAGLGDPTQLLTYERERLCQNLPIMLGVHGLQRLYGTDFSPIVALRSVGLRITNAFPPLKKILMSQAMG